MRSFPRLEAGATRGGDASWKEAPRTIELMPAQILDGLALSKLLRAEIKTRVDALREKGVIPRLEAIVAAQDPASLAYVRMKRRWAEAAGM